MIVDATVPHEYPYPERVAVPDVAKKRIGDQWAEYVDEKQLAEYRELN